MNLIRVACIAAALCLLSLPGPAQSDPSAGRNAAQSSLIGQGDVLEITVFDTPELDTRVRVSDDGSIDMALVGNIHVAGQLPQDAAQVISKKLQETNMVKSPAVNVFVSEFAFNRVSVLGEVKSPATFAVVGQMRLLDVVSQAGGLLPSASGLVTIAHRDAPDRPKTFVLSDQSQSATMDNPPILPGDTVIAQKAGIVYILGGVVRPGGFVIELNQKLSLLRAMALAEGPAPGAVLRKAVLLRTVDNQRQEIPVDLKALLHRQANDLQLQHDDILYVPVNHARAGFREGFASITSAAAYAAVYRF